METIDEGGEWWLPHNPERRVPGWLTYTVEDGAQLRLVGSFRDTWVEGGQQADSSVRATPQSIEQAGIYPRILGRIGPTAVTLEDCFTTSLKRNLFGGLPAEVVYVNQVFRGVWFEEGEDPCGDGIAVRLAHLVYWIRPDTIDETQRWPVGGAEELEGPVVEIGARQFPRIVLEIPTGTLTLSQRVSSTGDGIGHKGIAQDFVARIDTETVRAWRGLMNGVSQLQDVVTLAMDRVACIEAAVLLHPDVVEELPSGSISRRDIEVFARWSDRAAWVEPKDLLPMDLLFHHHVIGDDGFGQLLHTAAKYRAELRRVMATRDGRGMYNSDRLLNCCAALESFDRRRRKTAWTKFRGRMRACIKFADEPFAHLVGDTEKWLDVLQERRDHVAHHLLDDNEDDGTIYLLLADSAYFLFVLCLLREAQMRPQVFALVRENRRFAGLRRRLSSLLSDPST